MATKTLKPWQRAIKDKSEAKPTEYVSWYPDSGLIAADMSNPEYIKARDAKLAKRAAKKKVLQEKQKARETRAFEKGKIEGAKEYRKSDKFKKVIENAMKKGAKLAKPKQSLAERAAKKEEKAKKLMQEAKKLSEKSK